MRKLLLVSLIVVLGAFVTFATARVAAAYFPGDGVSSTTAVQSSTTTAPGEQVLTSGNDDFVAAVRASSGPENPELVLIAARTAAAGQAITDVHGTAGTTSVNGSIQSQLSR